MGGEGVATGGSHFGLRRRALFITTFVFVKAKKIFFCFVFFFSVGSQEFGVSIQFPFPRRVPSELRLQGCRCPPAEISVLGERERPSGEGAVPAAFGHHVVRGVGRA